MYCSWCGSHTHTENSCPKLAARQGTSHRHCSFCWSLGHTSDNCPKIWGNVRARQLEKARKKGEFDGVDFCE